MRNAFYVRNGHAFEVVKGEVRRWHGGSLAASSLHTKMRSALLALF